MQRLHFTTGWNTDLDRGILFETGFFLNLPEEDEAEVY